tara:strand:- start:17 stop:271 length:255 start_codon:yes stop_codon:yes gene_type:complete
MHNYKALKSASKVLVRKQDVNGREELQVVSKNYDTQTGESQNDSVQTYSLSELKMDIDHCKSQVARLQDNQADLEQLEKDLKAL